MVTRYTRKSKKGKYIGIVIIAAVILLAFVMIYKSVWKKNNSENISNKVTITSDQAKIYKNGKSLTISDESYFNNFKTNVMSLVSQKLSATGLYNTKASVENEIAKIKSQETALELLLEKGTMLNIIDINKKEVTRKGVCYLIPITGECKGMIFISDSGDYQYSPMLIQGKYNDEFINQAIMLATNLKMRKNEIYSNQISGTTNKNMNAVLVKTVLEKEILSYPPCDIWFGGFDKISPTTSSSTSTKETNTTVIGTVSMLGYDVEGGPLMFPVKEVSRIPIIANISQTNGTYKVDSYSLVRSDNDDIWKQIAQKISIGMQKQLLSSQTSATLANMDFVQWYKTGNGNSSTILIGSDYLLYTPTTPSPSIVTGQLRKDLIVKGMDFVSLCATKNFDKAKAMCGSQLSKEIDMAVASNGKSGLYVKGGEYAFDIKNTFGKFYQCMDPSIPSNTNNTYLVTIGVNQTTNVFYVYITFKVSASNEFLIDSIYTNE